jgi:hypothetical protein
MSRHGHGRCYWPSSSRFSLGALRCALADGALPLLWGYLVGSHERRLRPSAGFVWRRLPARFPTAAADLDFPNLGFRNRGRFSPR